ncbi:MAG: T9SS type A sorting domain-containing protein [Bacteroidia bacterium]|nr:T9SS type A sorting domain-containing protein [Bacteroidia bacterium]
MEGFYIGFGSITSSLNLFSSFTLFPNPASSSITATFSLQTKEDITLRLLDLAGKVIETRDFYGITDGEAVFDTGELSEGLYLLEVITPNGIGADKVIIRK